MSQRKAKTCVYVGVEVVILSSAKVPVGDTKWRTFLPENKHSKAKKAGSRFS